VDVGHCRKSPQGGRDCFQIELECHMSRFSLQNLRPNNLTSSESVARPVMHLTCDHHYEEEDDPKMPYREGRQFIK
jgi:hypothetical protein